MIGFRLTGLMQFRPRLRRRRFPILLLAAALWLPGLFVLSEEVKNPVMNPTAALVVNQVGYRSAWPKQALLVNAQAAEVEEGTAVELVLLDQDQTVAQLTPSPPRYDAQSQSVLQEVDLSRGAPDLASDLPSGHYQLRYGSLRSVPFQIGDDLYEKPLLALLRSFYLQRCGVELDDPISGLYHPPCHIHDGRLAHDNQLAVSPAASAATNLATGAADNGANTTLDAGSVIPAAGGWHDAGDYGKYVATTTVTLGRLLSLYEQQPQRFSDGQLSIPESGNGRPDLLDEMQFGLDWLLRMQRQDGAVYRKLSGDSWPHDKGPFEDDQPRYVYGISTPETGKFAATLAQAARIYQPWDAPLAEQYRTAALKAWGFLQREPAMRVDWVEGDDSGSGKYLYSETDQEPALAIDLDDRIWAAVELYLTTGDRQFEQYFEQQLAQHPDHLQYDLFEWKNPTSLALVHYLQAQQQPTNPKLRQRIRTQILARADQLLQNIAAHGYGLANQRFVWGSNKMTAEEGITLALAYQLTGQAQYRDGAIAQLDFLLGRNPFNLSFVSGVGDRPVKRVNHLFARAKNLQIPGLFVGGPNTVAQDNVAPKGLGLLSYVDDATSYATNEYAIDYNASLIGLISSLTASPS